MKKSFLFILSMTVALGITFYIKNHEHTFMSKSGSEWKTFIKKPGREIASHPTTSKEFEEAKIQSPQNMNRSTSSRSPGSIHNPFKGFMVRNKRILMGDIDVKYEDENTELTMINRPNPNWKEIMGQDLMRFQAEDTKLIVKEELPVINIRDGKGRFLEQVIITYLSKNGDRNSFKALVDSESGMVVETWDRTIHEHLGKARQRLTLPISNNNGATAY